ncbi:uroporphyrinogen decarboxylase family protein [Conexibacter sp. SYSU D00693]|uniref:uroporphyrinogen decarboxylase family protein n=1 Tax=Conexibacter sp. SYSU D00693 TaxID=2812560 RepID=UPI00196B32D6|nr:uroporphyrinogen decarboxylase family protein [Conexibacter sp. SYSU D00693]
MALRIAPVLDEVAARLSGRPRTDRLRDPVGWAYALRDAVAVAEPAVVVSHLDGELEAAALRAALAGGAHWSDRLLDAAPLARTAPTAEAAELVRTLVGVGRAGRPVAATLTGPWTVAARLAPEVLGDAAHDAGAQAELADLVADALAALLGAYAEAGASLVVVVEEGAGALDDVDRAGAHRPLVRALAHHRLDGVLWLPDGVGADAVAGGYAAVARAWAGTGEPPAGGAVRLDPALWDQDPGAFAARWPAIAAAAERAGADLVLSDGPVPGGAPAANLRAAAGVAAAA